MPTLSGPHNTSSFKKGLWWKVLTSVVILAALGFCIGKCSVDQNMSWYGHLNIPFYAPAPWLSKIMWAISYVLIGGSFGIIWHIRTVKRYPIIKKFAKGSMIIFGIHLLFNYLHPVFLLKLEMPVVALIDILILVGFILGLIKRFFRLDRIASFLLVPYFLWVIYNLAVNIAIVVIN